MVVDSLVCCHMEQTFPNFLQSADFVFPPAQAFKILWKEKPWEVILSNLILFCALGANSNIQEVREEQSSYRNVPPQCLHLKVLCKSPCKLS